MTSLSEVIDATASAAAITSITPPPTAEAEPTRETESGSGLVHFQYRFFQARVVATHRLGPSTVRVTFGGEQLRDFAGGGRDQSFSLFLPSPGQDAPPVPVDAGDGWYAQWHAVDADLRGVMRSYTVRSQDRDRGEIDVDFVLHGADGAAAGPAGPASRWAAEAAPGHRVVLLGPAVEDNRSVSFHPPADTDWVLIAADETALPAAAAILESLSPNLRVRAWIEVPDLKDAQDLVSLADADITWLVRDPLRRHGALLADEISGAAFPDGTPYAWIAGEAGTVRTLRRHLVGERGVDRKRVEFAGYWRLGADEEQLRAERIASVGATDDSAATATEAAQ